MRPSFFVAAFFGICSICAAEPPSHRDFRPSTFSRPSRTTSQYYGYNSRVFRSNSSHFGSSYRPPLSAYSGSGAAAGRSSYYRSVIGNYGSQPFTGLDASRRLYSGSQSSLYTDPYSRSYTRPYYLNNADKYDRAQSRRGH